MQQPQRFSRQIREQCKNPVTLQGCSMYPCPSPTLSHPISSINLSRKERSAICDLTATLCSGKAEDALLVCHPTRVPNGANLSRCAGKGAGGEMLEMPNRSASPSEPFVLPIHQRIRPRMRSSLAKLALIICKSRRRSSRKRRALTAAFFLASALSTCAARSKSPPANA